MKRKLLCLILALLLLSGCGSAQPVPENWEDSWTVVCPQLAVEPLEGFSLHEQNDALYLSGIYYATWVTGASRPHTNEAGEAAEVFDAQIYLILQEYRDPDAAKAGLSQWITREKTTFSTAAEQTATCGGQEFTLLPLTAAKEGHPYDHGVAAFAQWENWAICVEFLGVRDYSTDMEQLLKDFLSGFHFNG